MIGPNENRLSMTSQEVSEILTEHLEAQCYMATLGPRPLSPALRGLIWMLRLYVVFMLVAVVINVTHTLG